MQLAKNEEKQKSIALMGKMKLATDAGEKVMWAMNESMACFNLPLRTMEH